MGSSQGSHAMTSSQRLSKDACHEDLSDHTQRLLFSILRATLHRFSRRISNKSSHSLSSTCMEQLAAAVHPTRIDGCDGKESVALATAVHATRIHTEVDIMKSSSAQNFYFVEESRSLTESQHTMSFTGCSMTATPTVQLRTKIFILLRTSVVADRGDL